MGGAMNTRNIKIILSFVAFVFFSFTGSAQAQFTTLAADVPAVESSWTDQPQFLSGGTLTGTLLFYADGSPYILHKDSTGFQEFIVTSFPQEFFTPRFKRAILGKPVVFIPFQGFVDSWGFKNIITRQIIDKMFRDLYGE
jgi:hypothetical protein